jgi:hypothetical protein
MILQYSKVNLEPGSLDFQLTFKSGKDSKLPIDCYLENFSLTPSEEIVDQLMVPEEYQYGILLTLGSDPI